jgi:glycosyltransferase involved in cell wall biosynthesis
VCSDSSSLPEVAGEGAILVSPHDANAWVKALVQVLTRNDLRTNLRERGFDNMLRFSWAKCAQEVLQILLQAANSHKHS